MPYKYKDDKKKYHKEYHAKWYQENREEVREKQANRREEVRGWFKEYKATLQCVKCGENHPATLDFHHRDKSKKEISVHLLYAGAYSKKRILEEIDKCDVVCSNCHRKLHWDETFS